MIWIFLHRRSEHGRSHAWRTNHPRVRRSSHHGRRRSCKTQIAMHSYRAQVRSHTSHHRRAGHHTRRHPGRHRTHRAHRSHRWHPSRSHGSHSSRSHSWSHSSWTHWSHGRSSQALRWRDGVARIFAEFSLHECGSGGVYQGLGLVLHPFLVVELHVLFMFSSCKTV